MKKLRRLLAMFLAIIMVCGGVAGYSVSAKAEPGDPPAGDPPEKKIVLSIACDSEVIPPEESYGVQVTFLKGADPEASESSIEGVDPYWLNGNGDGSENYDLGVGFPTEATHAQIKVMAPEGYYVINVNNDNAREDEWSGGIVLAVEDIADDYHFMLSSEDEAKRIQPRDPSDIPGDDMWVWDYADQRYKMTIDESNPCDELTNILVPANYEVVIARDYSIEGYFSVDSLGYLTIMKNCTLSAGGGISIQSTATVTFGNEESATGFGELYRIENPDVYPPSLIAFDKATLDNSVFMSDAEGKLVYQDSPGNDCGIQLNSNGTIGEPVGEGDGRHGGNGTISYKIYADGNTEGAASIEGTLYEDWQTISIDPDIMKEGSTVVFHITAADGYKFNPTGIRFPDNKNVISTMEDETDGDVTCSYTFTYNPTLLCQLVVDFVPVGEPVSDRADFLWTYDRKALTTNAGFGTYVSHGTIEILSATKDGTPVINSNIRDTAPYWTPDGSFDRMREGATEWDVKCAAFEPGTVVVVRLIPDRGYQLTRFTISNIEGSTTPVDGVNEYTFVLERPDVYNLGAVFTKVEDKVDCDSASGITGGSVSFADGEIDNGTMALYVSDITPSAVELDNFNSMAAENGYTVNQCINLESEQRFYKAVNNASRDQCWVINKSELDAPAQISLNVAGINSSEVAVLHNHNGIYEEIDATIVNGKVTFSADSFSDFAIVSKPMASAPPANLQPAIEEKKEDNNSDENTAVNANRLTFGKISATGTEIGSWEDMTDFLKKMAVKSTDKKEKQTVYEPFVQLLLYNNETSIPAEVFNALSQTKSVGIHIFLGNATALSFMNDLNTKMQDSVYIGCRTTDNIATRTRTIAFRAYKKLKASVLLHSIVPKGTRSVTVFFTGKDGIRKKYGVYTPTADGRVCFAITELGKYEIEY